MKKYDSYKNSGVEWIGELPSHWDIKRIKHTTYVKGRIGWQGLRSDEFLEESDSYVVTGTDFKNGRVKWDTCYQVPIERYNEDPFIQLKNDDLLITKDGTIGKIAVVKDIPKVATLNSGVFLTRPLDNSYTSEFMYWVLYSEVFKSFYDFNKSGSTIQHLYQNVFNEFKFPLPKFKEQIAITNFLDHKTAQIDDLIAKKERLIQLLEEERTAIINQAVTKGLDPTVPMKDSGIEWLGEVPEHWEVTSLKRLIEVKDGTHDTPNYVEEGIPFITTKDIIKKEISFSQCKFITYEDYEKINKRSDVCIGDIIMPMIGSIGSPIIVNTDTPFSIKNLALIKNNSNCDIRFIRYYLDSELTMFQFELNTSGGVQNFVSLGSLRNLKIPKLTKEEQIKIADFLDFKENQFEECINKINNEIKLLKEYKTALISEVVTGKVDVRNEKLS